MMQQQSRRITYLGRKDELTSALAQNGFDRDTGGCVWRQFKSRDATPFGSK
jgi:hypothetical protein